MHSPVTPTTTCNPTNYSPTGIPPHLTRHQYYLNSSDRHAERERSSRSERRLPEPLLRH